MPAAATALLDKTLRPSTMTTAEWDLVSSAIRERSFFVAQVSDAETLQFFRDEALAIARGQRTEQEARKRIAQHLAARGYRPEPGKEGTMEDLGSLRRQNVTLDANVGLVRGHALWTKGQASLKAFPAWEFLRLQEKQEPRDWPTRWLEAIVATDDRGVVVDPLLHGGVRAALINHPIWTSLSRFGQPYPPFDYNSGMGVRPISRRRAEQLGLFDTPPPSDWLTPQPPRGLNDGFQARPEVRDADLLAALRARLGKRATETQPGIWTIGKTTPLDWRRKTTSVSEQLQALYAADRAEAEAAKNYRRRLLEGGGGYNPHETKREAIGKEIARLSIQDKKERALSLTHEMTKAIRHWVNQQKFGSPGAADLELREKIGITLDGLKEAMKRHGIV